MNSNFKKKILVSYIIVLMAASLLFSYILVKRESGMKIERLIYYMHPYTDIAYNSFIKEKSDSSAIVNSTKEIFSLIPSYIRVTITDTAGKVLFDNFHDTPLEMENHISRDEIEQAKNNGDGSALRYSTTLGRKFLYYAKRYPGYYVRTSLDYENNIYPLRKRDYTWQLYILLIFSASVVTLVLLTRKLSRPYYALKEFAQMIKAKKHDYDSLKFPKDQLGEVGEDIMNAFRELEHTREYKQQLTHNIAHELKTPVTGIRGYLETLIQEEEIDKDQIKFFLERAYAQSLRLSALVNDISVLNKIEEESDKFEYEKINILKCIREIESDLSFKLNERNIELTIKVPRQLNIEGNYLLIYSLFKNLIDNSIEHSGESTAIVIETIGYSRSEAYFTFYDTGKGVPENHIHRIFERFYRVEKGRSRKSGGSGLGLSIVKNAIMMHKGTITARNRTEGGLQFDFTLALKASSEQKSR
jgi:signal transduction histidine kinase